MPVSAAVKAHLPMMRRYARAYTGSQIQGDACIAALLERLIESPGSLAPGVDVHLALLRALNTILVSPNKSVMRRPANEAEWEAAAYRRLACLRPRIRQVFILNHVEGFAPADIAVVLDCDEDHARRLIGSATNEIAAQIATDVLIIEDEPIIALELEQVIESLGHTICGIARTHAEALSIHARSNAGLVLADIKLADGTSGVDAVSDMLARTSDSSPIIFITAYAERLLTGDRPDPTFLITKPFSSNKVKATVSQTLFFDGAPEAVA